MADEPFNYSGKLQYLQQACWIPGLVRADLAVLAAIVHHANMQSGATYASVAALVSMSGVPRSTALRSIRRLEARGQLVAERRFGATTTYSLTRAAPGTGPEVGTGAISNQTGAIQNLRRGQTGPERDTEPVPAPGHKQKIKQSNRFNREPARVNVELPAWLPQASWELWRKHRGKKLTALAESMSLKRLATLKADGHDPVKVIELAVESGWSSFNPRDSTKAHPTAAGGISRDARTDSEIERANQEQLARFGLGGPA